MDTHAMYPESSRELHRLRQELAPETLAAFRAFGEKVEMRAGAAYAHSNLALDTMNRVAARQAEGSTKA